MSDIIMSQSLAKSLDDYRQGKECGLVLKAKWVDRINFPSTDPMDLGNYFEFICTGQLPRDGSVPQAKAKKSGEYYTDYVRAHTQKENFLKVMAHYNFQIIETGTKLQKDGLGGIIDILVTNTTTGKKAIIDLKYSALINDKWSETGWSEDAIETKEKILIQAIQYQLLWRKIYGEDIDFYFFVFSSKSDSDYKIYKVEIDEDAYFKHEKYMRSLAMYFGQLIEQGFRAYPDFKKCAKCYLRENCSSRQYFPEIKTVYYAY